MTAVPWRAVDGGLQVMVRLTPRGGRDRIDGIVRDPSGAPVLAARVSAAPEDGKANAALAKLMAKALGVPKGAVTVEAGHTARLKRLRVAGDAAALAARLEALSARSGGG